METPEKAERDLPRKHDPHAGTAPRLFPSDTNDSSRDPYKHESLALPRISSPFVSIVRYHRKTSPNRYRDVLQHHARQDDGGDNSLSRATIDLV